MNYYKRCTYYSEAKHQTCLLEFGHRSRHFKYDDEVEDTDEKEKTTRESRLTSRQLREQIETVRREIEELKNRKVKS